MMAEELLDLDQIDTRFDQMRGIAMPQAVRRDLFFRPQASTTLCKAVCTPPGSIGVVAVVAPFKPPWRLGKSRTGLRCTRQKQRRC